jgi:uncharacterized GH25 family protein
MRLLRSVALVPVLMAVAAGAAQAHAAYLKSNFADATGREHVTVEASYSERIFEPDFVYEPEAFHVTGPDGTDTVISAVAKLKDLAVFEVPTPTDGLYRISTGAGQAFDSEMYRTTAGEWVSEEDGPLPAEAEKINARFLITAATFVSRGGAANVPTATGQGLEITPTIHPNDIMAGQATAFVVTFDGQPVSGAKVTVFRDGGVHDGRMVETEATTDAQGRFSISASAPGGYLAEVEHKPALASGETVYRSVTHTLTFAAGTS